MSSTQAWEAWVNGRIKSQVEKRERAMCGAIADVIAPIEKKYQTQLDELRTEVATLKRLVSEMHAEAKVRGALDEVQARLAKLETPPRLKAAG